MLKQNSKDLVEYPAYGSDTIVRISTQDVIEQLCSPTKSGLVCSTEDAQNFLQFCAGNRLNPWVKDCYLTGYDRRDGPPNFSPIVSVYAFLKRAEASETYDGMMSGVIVDPGWDCSRCNGSGANPKNDAFIELCAMCNGTGIRDEVIGDLIPDGHKLRGGWSVVKLKNQSVPVKKRILTARFNTGYQFWASDPAGMSAKTAEVDALRTAFPGTLGGMYTEGETAIEQVSQGGGATRQQVAAPEFDRSEAFTPPPVQQPKAATVTRQGPPEAIARPVVRQAPQSPSPLKSNPTPSTTPKPARTAQQSEAPARRGRPPAVKPVPHAQEEDPLTDGNPAARVQEAQKAPPDEATLNQLLRKLNALMLHDDINEEQVIVFAVEKAWIPGIIETLDELPQAWLSNLVKLWPEHIATIKEIQI